MNTDDENYEIFEIAYEHFGTKDIVVRLHDRKNFDKFHDLGVLIVEPTTAIVSLLDHFVRSPHATSLLLGTDGHQDTIDIELRNKNLHGIALRNLRLPNDVLILSVQRGEMKMVSHGYTRLRLGDVMTIVGSNKSIEDVKLKFD